MRLSALLDAGRNFSFGGASRIEPDNLLALRMDRSTEDAHFGGRSIDFDIFHQYRFRDSKSISGALVPLRLPTMPTGMGFAPSDEIRIATPPPDNLGLL
jgi:hypothetical protein